MRELQEWFGRVQRWESAPQSVAVMCAIVVGCYHPHVLLLLGLLSLFCYGLHRHTPEAGAPACQALYSACQLRVQSLTCWLQTGLLYSRPRRCHVAKKLCLLTGFAAVQPRVATHYNVDGSASKRC